MILFNSKYYNSSAKNNTNQAIEGTVKGNTSQFLLNNYIFIMDEGVTGIGSCNVESVHGKL